MTGRGPSASALRRRPKAELHLHLEGCVGPALLRRLLRQRDRQVSAADITSTFRFSDFDGFLRGYARICRWLDRAGDWREVVIDLGRRLRREGVLHAEVFFAASVHARNGIAYPSMVRALEAGTEAVRARGGPSLLFIADGVRQWGPGPMNRMVRDVLRHRSPLVVGVGMGGDERAVPAGEFADVLAAARRAGLALVVHAGEIGTATALREVVEVLGPQRIAHGVVAAGDRQLEGAIRDAGIVLDVCLTSNRRTGAAGGPKALLALLAAGVPTTLGTDDPALFRCTLSGEYARAAALGVSWRRLQEMALQAGRACLLPAGARSALIERLARGWA